MWLNNLSFFSVRSLFLFCFRLRPLLPPKVYNRHFCVRVNSRKFSMRTREIFCKIHINIFVEVEKANEKKIIFSWFWIFFFKYLPAKNFKRKIKEFWFIYIYSSFEATRDLHCTARVLVLCTSPHHPHHHHHFITSNSSDGPRPIYFTGLRPMKLHSD